MEMMQGDAYGIPIEIETENGIADDDSFSDVEVVIGTLTKTKSSGEIVYDADKHAFIFPITQQESISLGSVEHDAQVRVKLANGDVIGASLGKVNVAYSLSKEIL